MPVDPSTDGSPLSHSHRAPLRSSRRPRRWCLAGVMVLAVALVAGADFLGWPRSGQDEVVDPVSMPPLPVNAVATSTAASESPPPPTEQPPVLSLPGNFPTAGPGTFRYAAAEGRVLGESGPVRRFRLAIEEGTDEDLAELATFVDETLGDPRGWTASRELRFQRVPDGVGYDFTIYLVTGETAAQMCGAAGLDVRVDGVAYTSCRVGGQVILNLNRWRLSVPEYIELTEPLETYRQMVLNHELGHELGHGHFACPGPGEPAPVMQQQTLHLDECEPNPWPYPDGEHHHIGPPA